jgi:predicted AlkP superfamily pyrophosphatase or phosphodiesterase
MAHATAVILVVGLNRSLIESSAAAPRITGFANAGIVRTLEPVLPAVTCSVQSSMLTGEPPAVHGIIGNGWYNRELAEIHFWKQSNRLVRADKVWETAKRIDPSVTCANLFWWYNMYSTADYTVTPRPMYKADGRKIPDIYTQPEDLRNYLQSELGRFPLFQFWGPGSSIVSSRWITNATMLVHKRHQPTLTLVYLPHLDYALQKFGPNDPRISREIAAIDAIVGDLIDYFQSRDAHVVILSEYGIEPVQDSIHINRALREEGGLRIREEEGLELLDAGASAAFAVADHQVAHVYVKDEGSVDYFAGFCREIPGVEQVLDRNAQEQRSLHHERSGDLLLIADRDHWFSYDYWLEDSKAPDFARTVDIHRKPGYDPLELFIDPRFHLPQATIARKLLMRKLGFRTLLDVIPLDTALVRGSHGRTDQPVRFKPVLITTRQFHNYPDTMSCCAVRDVIVDHLGLSD